MFIYFALPMLIEVSIGIKGVRFDALTAAIITIIINAGAYVAEIVRGAVQSGNKGLIEAGLAMGISRLQLITSVIGPIAFKRAIPPRQPVHHKFERHIALYRHRRGRADPLMLPNEVLAQVLDSLVDIPHLNHARIGSRVPVSCPIRLFDDELIQLLGDFNKRKTLFIPTHFNHAAEITPEAKEAVM